MTDNAGYRPTDDSALRWEDCHCTKCGQPDKKCECVALTPGTKPTVSSNPNDWTYERCCEYPAGAAAEIESLRTQIEILQRANRFLSEQIPPAPETPEYRKWPGEPPHCMSCDCGMTDQQKRTVPFDDYQTFHTALMGIVYESKSFTEAVKLASDALQRKPPSEKALEPHPLMTPLPADEAATLREVIGEAPQRGPRLGDPHPPSCACWECCK